MQDDPKTLVSTEWLAAHLKDPDLRLLDGSWYLPQQGRDAKAEYDAAHIPGARFFDIDEISDKPVRTASYGAAGGKIHVPLAGNGCGRWSSGRGPMTAPV